MVNIALQRCAVAKFGPLQNDQISGISDRQVSEEIPA
jgi:hypothetical protein